MKASTNRLQAESLSSSKRIDPPEKVNPKSIKTGKKLDLATKLIIITSIVIIIILTAVIITVVCLNSKSNQKYKMEISDLETEKSVLENQNIKLNAKIKNLTDSNDNLNLTNINLNKKLAKVSSEEIKRNKTYETLSDITKEGVSLKTTFSAIAKGIETINLNSEAKLVESSSRESEENISTLKDKLELIKSFNGTN